MQCTPPVIFPHDPSPSRAENKTSHVQNAVPTDSQDEFASAADFSVDLQSERLMCRDMGTIMRTQVAPMTRMRQVHVQRWIDGAKVLFEGAVRKIEEDGCRLCCEEGRTFFRAREGVDKQCDILPEFQMILFMRIKSREMATSLARDRSAHLNSRSSDHVISSRKTQPALVEREEMKSEYHLDFKMVCITVSCL